MVVELLEAESARNVRPDDRSVGRMPKATAAVPMPKEEATLAHTVTWWGQGFSLNNFPVRAQQEWRQKWEKSRRVSA